MISCTEFIPAYSELYRYLEDLGGADAVMDYWRYVSDVYVACRLGSLVKEKGIMGCWEYWDKALNEEAADFAMEVDEEAGLFTIDMRYCPSKGRLLELEHMEPYHDYCGHCDVLYRRVLEPEGFVCYADMSRTDKAACFFRMTRQENPLLVTPHRKMSKPKNPAPGD